MKRLLRMSLDTLLMSTLPIVMWILLGVFLDKNISNVFTLTYPIQFVMGLLLAIFGIGANINATKNNKKYLVDSNIILGTIIGLVVTCLLISNVDKYIQFMSMDIEIYKSFCIYSFTLMYLQLVLQLICQKLYYLEKNKEANKLTILFNLINFFIIIILSYITNASIHKHDIIDKF
jgi:CDP-diglyceride synthetase